MLVAQTVAEGIDLVLGSIGGVEVDVVVVAQVAVHHVQGLLHQLAHMLQIGVQTGVEMHSVLALVPPRHGNLVDRVADGFEVVYDAQHGANALRGVLRHIARAHLGEELRDFHLHAVGDVLVFGYAGHDGIEGLVALGRAQARQEGVHAQHPLRELRNLALGALQVELGSAEPVALDVGQAELVLAALLGLGLHHPVHNLQYLRNEERQDDGVAHVEHRVEQRDGHWYGLGIVSLVGGRHIGAASGHALGEVRNEPHQRRENHQRNHHTHHVEHQVGTGGLLARRVGHHGRQVGRDGGADVLAHDQGHGHIEPDPAVVAHHQRNGHHGRRRLHQAGQRRTDGDEEQYGPEPVVAHGPQGMQESGILLKVGHGGLQQLHADEQQRQADDRLADGLHAVLVREDEEQAHRRQQHRQAEAPGALAQAKEGDDPRRHRGADVGTHDDRHGPRQRQQTGIDEADHHHRRGRRTLDGRRHRRARQDAAQRLTRETAQHGPHFAARNLLQSLAHQFHGEQEHGQCPGEIDDNQ